MIFSNLKFLNHCRSNLSTRPNEYRIGLLIALLYLHRETSVTRSAIWQCQQIENNLAIIDMSNNKVCPNEIRCTKWMIARIHDWLARSEIERD